VVAGRVGVPGGRSVPGAGLVRSDDDAALAAASLAFGAALAPHCPWGF